MAPRSPAPSVDLLHALRRLAFPSSPCSPQLLHLCTPRLRGFNPHVRARYIHNCPPYFAPPSKRNPFAPKHRDRGPESTEDTQTDFGQMDIFNTSSTPQPATSIDACTSDGFHLNNGAKTSGGRGILLFGGESFSWDPAAADPEQDDSNIHGARASQSERQAYSVLLDKRGTLDIPPSAWGVLELFHPKPDLLLLGTGGKLWMLSKSTRDYLGSVLGVRVDVMDTANASAAYNLLAQERGVEGGAGVGAAMLPLGWVGKR